MSIQYAAPDASLIPLERLRCLTAKIHDLGPRPLYELFRELDSGAELHPALEAYARLESVAYLIHAYGGDRLPAPRLAAGGR